MAQSPALSVYDESFEERRYSVWLAKTKNTPAFSPKEGSTTGMVKFEGDEDLGSGNGAGIKCQNEILSSADAQNCGVTSDVNTIIENVNDDVNTIPNNSVDMQTLDATSSPACSLYENIKVSDESFEEIRYSALVAESKTTAETQAAMTSPVVRVYYSNISSMNLYNESFEETRYSLWLSKNTLASSLEKGSMTGMPKFEADRDFEMGNGAGIECLNKTHLSADTQNRSVVTDVDTAINGESVQKEDNNGGLRKEGVSKDTEEKTANNIEFQNLGYDIAYSSPKCDFNANIDINAGKQDNMNGVLRNKVLMKGSKRAGEQECSEDMEKAEMSKKARIETPKASDFSSLNSDIVNTRGSNLLVVQNHGSHVMHMEIEKANLFNDASGTGNDDTNKENNSGIVSLVEAEVETSNATITDDMALTGEMEASKRRKRQKTEILSGGLDKDAIEKDVRNSLQGEGDRTEVTVMMHEKVGEENALSSPAEVHEKRCPLSYEKNSIFLGGIDKKWKNEDIVKLLQDIGVKKIDKVTVIPNPENPEHNRGFAFLKFQKVIDAQAAFSLLEKKSILGNQKIRVEWAKSADERKGDKLMREHASWRQPQRSLGVGSADLGYFQNMAARERPISYMLVPCYPDPRLYPRPWTQSSYPAVNSSILSPSLGMQSLPYYPLQGSSYPSGLTYEADSNVNHSQIRETQSLRRERKELSEGAIRSGRDSNRGELQIGNSSEREMYNSSNGGRDRFNRGRRNQPGGDGREQVEKWKHDLYEEDNKSPITENEDDYVAKVEALLNS